MYENANKKQYKESIIILKKNSSLNDLQSLEKNLKTQMGRVLIKSPPRILIAEFDLKEVNSITGLPYIEAVESDQIKNLDDFDLDDQSLVFMNAWNKRKSKSFADTKSARSDENETWDFHYKNNTEKSSSSEGGGLGLSSCNLPVEDDTMSAASESRKSTLSTDTSLYMIGNIAIGIIIVDGPNNSSTKFTELEVNNIVAEVQEGTNILTTLSPQSANLSFLYDLQITTLTLNPQVVRGEEDWRNLAMSNLGYEPGSLGLYDYLNDLRFRKWPDLQVDWAYIAFFTKYAAQWFAYAQLGGPRLVMQYDNNGWGPSQIDRVFAHETGHIFHAPDEYSNSECNINDIYGFLQVPNCNCEIDNPNSVDCIMKKNTQNICACSLAHFGWRDSNSDGILDPIDHS